MIYRIAGTVFFVLVFIARCITAVHFPGWTIGIAALIAAVGLALGW
jgi:hypothetical protein